MTSVDMPFDMSYYCLIGWRLMSHLNPMPGSHAAATAPRPFSITRRRKHYATRSPFRFA
ncbi:hypothetical protein BLAT2472_170037 [Burkholderia latens]